MKYQIIIAIILSSTFFSCNNYAKEDGEIESLKKMVDNTEEVLLSVDTARTFKAIRSVKKELWGFGNRYDTLDKESAFKVADYYANKKSLYFFYDNYSRFIREINTTRKQLDNLKQDLHNNAITKEQFLEYYKNEQELLIELNNKINNSVNKIDTYVGKLEKDKESIMELLAKFKKDTLATNE